MSRIEILRGKTWTACSSETYRKVQRRFREVRGKTVDGVQQRDQVRHEEGVAPRSDQPAHNTAAGGDTSYKPHQPHTPAPTQTNDNNHSSNDECARNLTNILAKITHQILAKTSCQSLFQRQWKEFSKTCEGESFLFTLKNILSRQ